MSENNKGSITTAVAWIVRYYEHTPIINIALHFLMTLVLVFGMAFAWVVATQFDYIIAHLEQNDTSKLKASVESVKIIQDALTTLNANTGASRAYVFKYHDGTPTTGVLPFLFQSELVEVVSPGIASTLRDNQRIPIATNLDMIQSFLKNQCYSYLTQNPPINAVDHMLIQRGVKKVYSCPLFGSRGELTGYVGVSFIYNPSSPNDRGAIDALIFRSLQTIALQIERLI